MPRAVKGFKDIQLSEGKSITFSEANEDFNQGDSMYEKTQQNMVTKLLDAVKALLVVSD